MDCHTEGESLKLYHEDTNLETTFHIYLSLYQLCYYSPFHKTLQRSSIQMHWISVRFYESGDM